jgi:hypothetical protein
MAYEEKYGRSKESVTRSGKLLEKLLCQDICPHQRSRVRDAQQYYQLIAQPRLFELSHRFGFNGCKIDMQRQFEEFLEVANIGRIVF